MVKSYLKFEHSKTFGQVCSASANVVWDAQSENSLLSTSKAAIAGAGCAIVAATEEVLVWDIKKGELLNRWNAAQNTAQVTLISRCQASPDLFAVGYEDGKIRIWDLVTATVIITFNGHKSAITQLVFDSTGGRLASGSRDTDIIVWDLVAELGLYRLRGHKDQITSLNFLNQVPDAARDADVNVASPDQDRYLLSTSKDALIKVWDLSSQHCIETHVTQTNGECWALGLSPDASGCITAGNQGEMKAWSIDFAAMEQVAAGNVSKEQRILHDRGTFYRQGRDRPLAVVFHSRRDLIAIHGSEKAIEIWRIRSESEIRKAMARKKRRRREKLAEQATDAEPLEDDPAQDEIMDDSPAPISEVFVSYVVVRTGGKVRSMDWAGGKSSKSVSVLVSTANNQLEMFDISLPDKKKSTDKSVADYNRTLSVDMPGHRSDIRCLALSSDDRMLASASHGSLKIWNVRTQNCLRTLDCGYAICATFLPGDKIVVLGTRDGTLEIFDIASSTLLDTITAHERDVWSLHVSPEGKSLVTGSADKCAKFWEFKVVQEEVLGTTRKVPKLTLVHTRTLKVADDILSIRFSPDGRLLALSTLDNTIKVFFVDSLKLYLTLYGHKLPVLSMDISHDSKLIVTSSADKNIRVWGLDFGDCHKAFFAHQDSILSVGFVPTDNDGNGHHFFSASKDRMIKYFDADKFEQIQKLSGHHGEIWAMAIANSGEFTISASHDKSIRIWTQTDEQVFLEEEREKELEELYDNTLLTSLENDERNAATGADQDTLENGGVVSASKQTTETLMAGEKIAEALTIGIEDLDLMQAYHSQLSSTANTSTKIAYPQRNPIFLAHNNISASEHVLRTFQRIPAASLQDALLVLSFSQLPSLLRFLAIWAEEGRDVNLTCRVLFFMLKIHQNGIVSGRVERRLLEDVRRNLRRTLQMRRDELGFNLAGLRVVGRRVRDVEAERGFVGGGDGGGEIVGLDGGAGGKKRSFVNVA